MAYLGRGLDKISNIEVLDNITFDGSSSYSITKGSVAFTPNSAQSLLISIDGVVQATNFSVNSSTIDFGVAIPSTSVCNFFLHYGTGVMTVPSDGSVTNAKLGSGSFSNITGVGTLSSGLTLSDNILFDTADKGIYLGVTSATASNLLDDYEEGTWTPSMEFAAAQPSAGNTTGTGFYTKIGNMVTVWGTVLDVNVTGASGDARVRDLPFTSKTSSPLVGWHGTLSLSNVNITATNAWINCDVQDGFSYIRFIENIDNTTRDLLNVANFNHGTSDAYFCVSYQVD